MKKPKATYLQRRGWEGAYFNIVIQDLVVASRRLRVEDSQGLLTDHTVEKVGATKDFSITSDIETKASSGSRSSNHSASERRLAVSDIRVLTVLTTEGCSGTAYHMETKAIKMAATTDRYGNL